MHLKNHHEKLSKRDTIIQLCIRKKNSVKGCLISESIFNLLSSHYFFTIMNIQCEMLWVLLEKILSLYFNRPKTWIWRSLGGVMNVLRIWHFHNNSKEVFWPKIFLNFMHGFKNAIFAKFSFYNFCSHTKNSKSWTIEF